MSRLLILAAALAGCSEDDPPYIECGDIGLCAPCDEQGATGCQPICLELHAATGRQCFVDFLGIEQSLVVPSCDVIVVESGGADMCCTTYVDIPDNGVLLGLFECDGPAQEAI